MRILPASLVRIVFAVGLAQWPLASFAEPACKGGTITLQPGTKLDLGWTGVAHSSSLPAGAQFGFGILSRCSDSQTVCNDNSDCGDGECLPTCECGLNETCEVTGPIGAKRCHYDLTACSTNDDCTAGSCNAPFGPPVPLSWGGTPVCVVNFFEGDLGGTVERGPGAATLDFALRTRIFSGIAVGKPCPRCGPPDEDPAVGQQFTCSGGPSNGAACVVDAVSELYGGTSFDCPPENSANITGQGLVYRFPETTTGTTSRTAQLPCKQFGFTKNPLDPTSNPKCTDKRAAADPVCASNADCRRCSGATDTPCGNNTDCAGKGTCLEAPDQPVTCGDWCHCGFCSIETTRPCFENRDCPEGQSCKVGTGSGTMPNSPQQKPNDCSGDGFICGTGDDEVCESSSTGSCSLQPYRFCNPAGGNTCETNAAGTCVAAPKACFESRIARSGHAAPYGRYCSLEQKACTGNADCATPGDTCIDNASGIELAAVFCSQATASSFTNTAVGISGPGALRLNALLQFEGNCSCGDGEVTCGEACDDGNNDETDACTNACTTPACGDSIVQTANNEACDDGDDIFRSGEYCQADCKRTPCGKPIKSAGVKPVASDALYALKAALMLVFCDKRVCDVDANGTILSGDAVRILRAAVGQTVTLRCPNE